MGPHIGVTELIIIMVVILLLFGAKRIPEVAGSFGKGIKEFKKQMNEVEQMGNGNSYSSPRLTSDDLQRSAPPANAEPTPEPKRLL